MKTSSRQEMYQRIQTLQELVEQAKLFVDQMTDTTYSEISDQVEHQMGVLDQPSFFLYDIIETSYLEENQ